MKKTQRAIGLLFCAMLALSLISCGPEGKMRKRKETFCSYFEITRTMAPDVVSIVVNGEKCPKAP